MSDTAEAAKPQDPQMDADALVIEALFRQTADAVRESHRAMEKLGAAVGERDRITKQYNDLAGGFKNVAFAFANHEGTVSVVLGDDQDFTRVSLGLHAAHALASNILDAISQIEAE